MERRTVTLTEANIQHRHIYLSALRDFFPASAIGGPSAAGAARLLSVDWGGPNPVDTDIAGDKMIFRKRGWVRQFFSRYRLSAGDAIVIEKLSDYRYRIARLRHSTTTLDKFAPPGGLLEKLRQLNRQMKGISPKRIKKIVDQQIRRDTKLIKALKAASKYRCQFPACGLRIPMRKGGYYIEVAHVAPVSKGGRSVLGNLLVLCPNHHKEFDYGDLKILEQTEVRLRGTLNGKKFDITLPH
jgi:hypothetical protein